MAISPIRKVLPDTSLKMHDFRTRLKDKTIIIGDGAMGTMLQQICGYDHPCLELLNLSQSDQVREISRRYVDAGAEIIQTNTFGASAIKLAEYGYDAQTEEINSAAVMLAKEAADGKAWVAGSIGPCGRQLFPFGDLHPDEFKVSCKRQVSALADAGVDAFAIETMMDVEEAVLIIEVAKEIAPDIVVIASATFNRTPKGYYTPFGNPISEVVSRFTSARADIIGSNCGCGIAQMIKIAREMRISTDLPISIRPNAGLPEMVDGKPVWKETPEYFAKGARELQDIGVNIIGGCCGTTPEHIREIASVLGVRSQSRRSVANNIESQPAGSRPDATGEILSPPRSAGGNKREGIPYSSRELVRRTLIFQHPDRIPRDLWLLPWAEEKYPKETADINRRFPSDIIDAPEVYHKSPRLKGSRYEKGYYTDEWGCTFKKIESGTIGEVETPILQNIADWRSIRPPYEILPSNPQHTYDELSRFYDQTDKFVLANCWLRPWERYQFIRGAENALIDVLMPDEGFKDLLRVIHEYYLRELEFWVKADVDAVKFMDDWGAQDRLLIHPDLWRELFKPLYREYCDLAKSHGKFVFMHSDGWILDILEDLVEVGVDAVNSQLFCMDMAEIARHVKGRITFWGEIDRQHVLVSDDPEVGREAVREVARHLYDPSGGVIAQLEFGLEAKPETVMAVFEEWEKFSVNR